MKKVDKEGNCYFEYLNYMNSLDKKDLLEYAIGADLLSDRLNKRIDKAIEYIQKNCILSDEWTDLDFCNFIPTGKVTYKQLTPKKVKELLEILDKGVDKE